MRISHEVPLELLEESKSFNDYDYCLLHLTYEYPEYKQFYINASISGREVLLDNSLFELGDSLTLEAVAQGVRDIHPTWVVVPDCLNDVATTIERFKEWEEKYKDLDVKTIGVVQGRTEEELTTCYKFMSAHADKIAIPFGSEAFYNLELFDAPDQLIRGTFGRQYFIDHLIEIGCWNYGKPHHLLGCNLAIEFANPLYKRLNIETIDTSNPVVAALYGLQYKDFGLLEKPAGKLCDLIAHRVSPEEKQLILENIKKFKILAT